MEIWDGPLGIPKRTTKRTWQRVPSQFGMGKESIYQMSTKKKCGFCLCGWEDEDDEVGVGDAITSWADCMVKLLQNHYPLVI